MADWKKLTPFFLPLFQDYLEKQEAFITLRHLLGLQLTEADDVLLRSFSSAFLTEVQVSIQKRTDPLFAPISNTLSGKSFYTQMELQCYHGSMTKENCEKILTKKGKNGSFLIRNSESIPGVFCLCVFYEQIIYTYRIFKKHNGHFMIQTSEGAPKQDFRTLKDLVATYEKPNQGLVIHLCYPVNRPMAQQGSPRRHKPVSHQGSPSLHKPVSQRGSPRCHKPVCHQGSPSLHKPVCHQGSQSFHKEKDDTYVIPEAEDGDDYVDVLPE